MTAANQWLAYNLTAAHEEIKAKGMYVCWLPRTFQTYGKDTVKLNPSLHWHFIYWTYVLHCNHKYVMRLYDGCLCDDADASQTSKSYVNKNKPPGAGYQLATMKLFSHEIVDTVNL